MTKLEILDLAVNKIEKVEGLEGQFERLDELWMNDNKIADFKDIEYLGQFKALSNLYIATNPCYSRSNEFIKKIKAAVPSLQ